MFAADKSSEPAVIHTLLNANPDVNIKDFDRKTAWYYINKNENLRQTTAYFRLNNLRFKWVISDLTKRII